MIMITLLIFKFFLFNCFLHQSKYKSDLKFVCLLQNSAQLSQFQHSRYAIKYFKRIIERKNSDQLLQRIQQKQVHQFLNLPKVGRSGKMNEYFIEKMVQKTLQWLDLRSTENTLYRQGQDFELWGHLHHQKLQIQLKIFDQENQGKVYGTVLSEIAQDGKKILPKELFSALTCHSEIIVEAKYHEANVLIYDIPTLLQNRNLESVTMVLPAKKDMQMLDNFMIVSMLEDHIRGLSMRTVKVEQALSIADWEDPEPIVHQTSKYCFKAAYCAKQHTIQTSLWIPSGKQKQKQYQNSITQQYFGSEIKNTFGNLQNLFQHLRNFKNYQVNYDEGRIIIINQPKNEEEIEILSRKVEQRKKVKKSNDQKTFQGNSETSSRPSFFTFPTFPTERSIKDSQKSLLLKNKKRVETEATQDIAFDKKLNEQTQYIQEAVEKNMDRKFTLQENKIMMNLKRQLHSVSADINDKIFQLSKGIKTIGDFQLPQPSHEKKIDVEILQQWKATFNKDILCKVAQQDRKVKSQLMSLISQAKRQLAVIIHKLRNQFDTMLQQNEQKCMQSIDDLEIDLIQKIEIMSNQNTGLKETTHSDPTQSIQSLTPRALRNLDWNPIQIQASSGHLSKFIVEFDNVVIYNNGWEWTQLFTQTIIPHGKIITLEFKIIKSAYNAIAIGVSDRSNIRQKTSLSLKNSIAYWGDRQIWEGKKVKEEGIGFKTGDIVTMRVDTIQGIISWGVGNDLRAQHTSPILRDRSLHLMGYIEMYDKGDKVEMLSYKLLE